MGGFSDMSGVSGHHLNLYASARGFMSRSPIDVPFSRAKRNKCYRLPVNLHCLGSLKVMDN